MKTALFIALAICLNNAQIDSLVSRMTLEEKISMIHGNTMFTTAPVDRLGIPGLSMSDGPHGVCWERQNASWSSAEWQNDSSSYMPALSALAATWNVDLAYEYGAVVGSESKARGKNIQLAPGVNITRSPLNGRTWEYFGEDPYMVSRMCVPYIKGIQSQGVAACVKHFALNSQAIDQYHIDTYADDRAIHEIYTPAFDAAINEAGAKCVMLAYNKVRGKWCSESEYLIDTLLRREFGFEGVAISDWNAVHSTLGPAMAGLDIEMGTSVFKGEWYDFDNFYMAAPLLELVRNGVVDESVIDAKVRRILRLMSDLELFGAQPYDTLGMSSKLATKESAAVALKVAEESIVLLKNNGRVLPLSKEGLHKVAVIGANAGTEFAYGGGSTTLKPKYEVTALDGIKSMLGSDVEVSYAPGYKLLDREYIPAAHRFTDEFDLDFPDLVADAVAKASDADLVLYVGGLTHEHGSDCEGYDRPNLKLPYRQDELISKLMDVNPNVVVVLMAGSPVEMGTWYDRAEAVVQCSFLGMEGGHALANVLWGKVNPSAKLTNTWPMRLEDCPDHALGEYPGDGASIHFNEGIMVGYRYYDTYKVEPRFEFGYGLSYTSFKYSSLRVRKRSDGSLKVSCRVRNTGEMDGAETVQFYVSALSCPIVSPEKELKAFAKVFLKKGRSKRVRAIISSDSLRYYDNGGWQLLDGGYVVSAAASSRDIRLRSRVVK